MRFMMMGIVCGAAALGFGSMALATPVFYVNPFTGGTSNSATLATTSGLTAQGNVTQGVDGGAGGYNVSQANYYTASNGPLQFQWGGSGTTVRTLIHVQNLAVAGFTTPSTYYISTENGNLAGSSTSPLSGVPSSAPIVVTNLATPVSGSQLQVNFLTGAKNGATNYFYAMQEVLPISDSLLQVATSGGTATNANGAFPASQADDGREDLPWLANDGNAGDFLKINLANPSSVGALLLSNYPSRPETFTITLTDNLGGNTVVPNPASSNKFTLGNVTAGSGAEFQVLKLDQNYANISSITLTFDAVSGYSHTMSEIMPFTVVATPEPCTMGVLSLAALGLLGRSRKVGRK